MKNELQKKLKLESEREESHTYLWSYFNLIRIRISFEILQNRLTGNL